MLLPIGVNYFGRWNCMRGDDGDETIGELQFTKNTRQMPAITPDEVLKKFFSKKLTAILRVKNIK